MTGSRTRASGHPLRHQSGVSLIELMVSLLIGSLLIVGAVTVYMQSRTTYRTTESAARLQELARYAIDIIEPDVRMAGYWGLTNMADFVDNSGGPADTQQAVDAGVTGNCGNNWTVDTDRFIDGRNNGVYDLACAGTSPSGAADVLIVRRASSEIRALTANRMQIQTNRARGVIFSDGLLPTLFATMPGSETHDLLVHAYYVSQPAGGPSTLRRKTLVQGAGAPTIEDQEILPGVEDIQVQFGIDSNGDDGNADQYVNPGAAALANARVVSVRIWVRVVAQDAEVGFADGTNYAYADQNFGTFADSRRRLVVSKTIQLRNALTSS